MGNEKEHDGRQYDQDDQINLLAVLHTHTLVICIRADVLCENQNRCRRRCRHWLKQQSPVLREHRYVTWRNLGSCSGRKKKRWVVLPVLFTIFLKKRKSARSKKKMGGTTYFFSFSSLSFSFHLTFSSSSSFSPFRADGDTAKAT